LAWQREGRWDYEGKYWTFRDVAIEPAPIQKPPPLWIGASSRPSIAAAGARNFNLLLDQAASFETIGERVAAYKNALAAGGQPWEPKRVALTRSLIITKEKDEAWERSIARRQAARERLRELIFAPDDPRLARPEDLPTGNLYYDDHRMSTEQSAIMGTPNECIEKLKYLAELGVEPMGSVRTSRWYQGAAIIP